MDELRELMSFYGQGSRGELPIFQSYLAKTHRREIPEAYPEVFSLPSPYLNYFRRQFTAVVGHTLVAKSWVRPLAELIGGGRVLEVMSGTGALALALRQFGVSVTATDNFSWKATFGSPWTEILKKGAVPAVKRLGREADFILMSWPWMDSTAAGVLDQMRRVNPRCRMIYIGEPQGGCTADDEFFRLAEPAGELSAVNSGYRRWFENSDGVYLFK